MMPGVTLLVAHRLPRTVELDIAGRLHPMRLDADLQESIRVQIGLHQGNLQVSEHPSHKKAVSFVGSQGLGGNPAVDQKALDSGAVQAMEKTRPKVGFDKNKQMGSKTLHDSSKGPPEIEGH